MLNEEELAVIDKQKRTFTEPQLFTIGYEGRSLEKYINILLNKCIETAKRCNALVFVNALYEENNNFRNTTYVYNRKGALIGKYFKKHLPPLELNTLELDSDYTFEFSEPYVIEVVTIFIFMNLLQILQEKMWTLL